MSRIFLAGAAGVAGRRLTPLLVAHRHPVWGMTRSPSECEFLRDWARARTDYDQN
jgi:nucleoside-diphosphate-sugar epimerase